MSAFILPTSCRCPQRSMLSHFITPPIATSPASRATRTRIITTTATTRTQASPASFLQHQDATTGSLFTSEPFLLNATIHNSESKIFAPQYQQHAPIQSKYQPPFTTPPVPKKQAPYFQQDQQVYPSHLQRLKRQPSLKHASYASRTIPPMMTPAPRTNNNSNHSALDSYNDSCSDFQFDRAFLDLAKRRLNQNKHVESHHFDYCKDKPLREAAVFMPLCVVKGVPSVLFTVRSTKMRNHRGECSFPGGKRDLSDENCLATALREMEEEIFISPKDVELLGEYSPMPNKDCTMRVQPYVGFIRTPIDDIASIRYNPDEVQKVFSIPIADLLNPEKRKQLVRFRDSKYMYPVWHVEKEDCTVWGLTAFILDGVLRRMVNQGPLGAMVCPEGADIQRYRPIPAS
ncbi:nudix (nucleoside diphosphate linked moiety X)-type motif 8 [Haplosporangium sp. Z 11]|nr:nudix (nucleoside diphosphate linked moiety X)-type motif 8 [Haplosporangium sp. Z 11]